MKEEAKATNEQTKRNERPKMKPEVKKLWVEALRSGEYSQCVGTLAHGTCNCAQGVLCELAVKQGVVEKVSDIVVDGNAMYMYGSKESGFSWAIVPPQVIEWSNYSAYVWVKHNGNVRTIGFLNDSGLSFLELADLIEEQL